MEANPSTVGSNVWGTPVVLGAPINMPGWNSRQGQLFWDRKTLFFSSDRGNAYAQISIYASERSDLNSWSSWSAPVKVAGPSSAAPTTDIACQ